MAELTPYLAVRDARAAIQWYGEHLGAAVTPHLMVDDVDRLVERVVAGGATLDRGPEDGSAGRVAVFRDPFGHRWFLNAPAE